MKKINKLLVPNERFGLERSLVAGSNALFRFEAGQEENEGPSCIYFPCESGVIVCTSDITISGSSSVLYHFNADDPGGDPLSWQGILSNQGGSNHGAEGTDYYYFKSSSPRAYSRTMTIGGGSTVRVTGYVALSTGNSFGIGFTENSPGTEVTADQVIFEVTLATGPKSTWTAFDSGEFTIPEEATTFALHKGGSSASFDEVRIHAVSAPDFTPGECYIFYQDGSQEVLSGLSAVNSMLAYQLEASGSQSMFELPVQANEVSDVFIDFLPTDVWDYVPESNVIVLPEAVLNDTIVMVRFLT